MTEQVPSKEPSLPNVKLTPEQDARAVALGQEIASNYLGAYSLARVIVSLQDKLDTCGLQCSATFKSLVAENERLRTTLAGISTCSTCEACRGAAKRAVGIARRVGCETPDGLLKIHREHESCEVCSTQPPRAE